MKIIALIPARGGSKEIPRKNIKPLLGKPLIAWTIKQAKESECINKVAVSTDDNEIAEISKKHGAEVIERPKELARDDSPTIDAIIHAIDRFEKRGEYFDIIVLLEPTSPLRKKKDIDNAIELFLDNINNADSLISLGEIHLEHPTIAKTVKNGYVVPFIENEIKIFQRQQLPKVYFPYGVIYLSKVDALKKYRTFYQKRTIPYYTERWQNYEIDDIYDFMVIETIFKYKKGGEIL